MERDASGGEGMLYGRIALIRIAISGYRYWTREPGTRERRADILSDQVRIAATWHLTVFDVPPHRHLRFRVQLVHRAAASPSAIHRRFLFLFLFFLFRAFGAIGLEARTVMESVGARNK